ncbi:hypothetical protein A2U01_0033973, partial [Trifolium medium]|nr:hypothetical protein [Trifolium medium]
MFRKEYEVAQIASGTSLTLNLDIIPLILSSNLEVIHKENTSLIAKEQIGGNVYEMVLLTPYGSDTLHLWNFAWLVHQGNADFSNFTIRIFGRHSVNQFVIAYKEGAVKEATWKTKVDDMSQFLKLRLEDKSVSQEG